MVERYRIEWREGPRLLAGESWVIDLSLTMSVRSGPFRAAKPLQVVIPVEDLAEVGVDPDWRFWRAAVAVAAGTVLRRLQEDRLHLDRPRQPFQLVPDLHEAVARAEQYGGEPIEPDELISELAAD
jgi:hypothetical protein